MSLPSIQRHPANSSPGEPADRNRSGLAVWFRLGLILAGAGLLGLLVVARCLEPDPEGLGTHRQLGFPPCGFLLVSGYPCPSCGMTTAWSHFTRGNLVASAESNVGGMLLAAAALPVAIWLLASGSRGNWFLTRPNPVLLIAYTGVTLLATVAQWWLR